MIRFAALISIIVFVFLPADLLTQQADVWEKLSTPVNKTLRNISFVDAQTGWASGESGTIIHTSDGGDNWIVQNSSVQTFIVDIFFISKTLGWALTFKDSFPFGTVILKTTNGGETWVGEDYPDDNVFMNTVFFFDSVNGLMGGTYIATTINGGLSWVEAEVDSNIISGLPVYNFNFYTRNFGYACGGYLDLAGVIWKTTNYGFNWYAEGVSPDQVFDIFIKDSLNAIALSGDPEGLYGMGNILTTNAGLSWSYEEMSLSGLSFSIDFRNETEGWSASGYKFMVTFDGGLTWEDRETPDSAVIYDLVFLDSVNGFASGENGVILKYVGATGIDENNIVPSGYFLHQNYPNPFNIQTVIKYDIPERSYVSINIYDVLGNQITSLINEFKSAGRYEVTCNAESLTSGVYYYQLITKAFFQSKKMILLK